MHSASFLLEGIVFRAFFWGLDFSVDCGSNLQPFVAEEIVVDAVTAMEVVKVVVVVFVAAASIGVIATLPFTLTWSPFFGV